MSRFQCVLHGSLTRAFDVMVEAKRVFEGAGIKVLAPALTDIVGNDDGFILFEGEAGFDPRLIELRFLEQVAKLGGCGFSYFCNPQGRLGTSASYEFGAAQIMGISCFFMCPLQDHPGYVPASTIWSPHSLAEHIRTFDSLPVTLPVAGEEDIHVLFKNLQAPGSCVAVGGMIEFRPRRYRRSSPPLNLFVKTHKWGGRYSIVGETLQRGERLDDGLRRGIREETGLRGEIGRHIVTFDKLPNSGYFKSRPHIFVDLTFRATSRQVTLNEEAERYVWMPAAEALISLDLEPNARHLTELYLQVA